MTPGQIDIDDSEIVGACDDCPDPATCQAENFCGGDLDTLPAPDERWDEP